MGRRRRVEQESAGLAAALRQLYAFMSPRRRMHFGLALLLMLLGAIAETAAIASVLGFLSLLAGDQDVSRTILGGVLEQLDATSPGEQVYAAAYLFMVIALIAGTVRLTLAWTTQRFVHGLGHDVALEIMNRMLHQPYRFHTQHHSSGLLSSLDKSQVLVHVLLQLMQATAAALITLFIVTTLIIIDPLTAIAAATLFGLLYLGISTIAAGRLARNSEISSKAYAERLRLLHESLGGIRDVIIDESQPVFLEAFRTVDRRFARAVASTDIIAIVPRLMIETLGMVALAGLALMLSAREGGLSTAIPVLGATALGALRLMPFAQQLYASWATLAGNRTTFMEVLALLRLPVPDRSGESSELLPMHREIRLDDVHFSHDGRHPVLSGVSLVIARGSKVALTGRSGSGKSTLADLLMGLLDPDAGRILVDDVALTPELRRRWRRGVAHVPQSIFLADATIAQNIAMGVPHATIDQARMAEAVRVAQLEEVVASLPDGLETRVGEGGVRLSGGQRQRVGIARAVYKHASVLVLDEATSSLDEATESAVLDALTALGDEPTIVIITHRPSAIARCDRLLYLERGRPVETAPIAAK